MRSRLLVIVLVPGVILGVGCHPHVQLPEVPARDAPAEEREAAYEELAPSAVKENLNIGITRTYAYAFQTADYLMLRGGLRIYHPEDLLPAIDASSPTAQYIDAYRTAMDRKAVAEYVILGSVGVGLAAVLAGIPYDSQEWQPAYTVAIAAGSVYLLSSAVAILLGFSAENEKESAFLSYDGALKKRLGLVPAVPGRAPVMGLQ